MGPVGEDGALTVLDRLKNMIFSGGVNIYSTGIERAMASIEHIAEIGVFGTPSARWRERVVAMVHGCPASDADRIRAEAAPCSARSRRPALRGGILLVEYTLG